MADGLELSVVYVGFLYMFIKARGSDEMRCMHINCGDEDHAIVKKYYYPITKKKS